MFVKKSWNTYKGKKSVSYHIVEGYWDPEKKQARHRYIMNISSLPKHVIESIDQAFKRGETVVGGDVKVTAGDTLRGAGLLSVYRIWKHERMEQLLSPLTPAQRKSMLAMVTQRILQPGSKLSLKEQLGDSIFSRLFSKKRLNENELYRVMDNLHESFYDIQHRIQKREDASPVLLLYDCTSTYFEGECAEEGEYGYSRDKRWDRYQVVVGLVCSGDGIPIACEVWPGSTPDKSTVSGQVKMLRDRFNVERVILVGDKGMYHEAAIEEIERAGFDYILSLEWRKQRRQLEALTPHQMSVFDEEGVVQWEEDGVRYVGCVSELKRRRAKKRREDGMKRVQEQLQSLSETARKGRYYKWTRLRERVNDILDDEGVKGLWRVDITALEEIESPEQRARLQMTFEPDEEAVSQAESIDGKYVLETSLSPEEYSAQKVDETYRSLAEAERAFRHMKSFLKIRPIYHYKRERVRAHVLICFLAYYLVKKMEMQMRQQGEEREVERVLRRWDRLGLSQITVEVGDHKREEWQWSMGEMGETIRDEIRQVGWWRSLASQKTSVSKKLNE